MRAAATNEPSIPEDSFCDWLTEIRGKDYDALTFQRNPVVEKLRAFAPAWEPERLQCDPELEKLRALVLVVVEQYTIFPRRIIELLMEARDRVRESIKSSTAAGVAGPPRSENAPAALYRIESELLRNIGQELGSESKGKKHYDMLVDGLKAYGMRNVRSARPHADSTSKFIDAMLDSVGHDKTLLFNLGAVYAMESTAVPELKIVRAIVLGVFRPEGARPTRAAFELNEFFRRHLEEWEPTHRDYLYERVRPLLVHENAKKEFENGFRAVLEAMDRWWAQLATILDDTASRSAASHC